MGVKTTEKGTKKFTKDEKLAILKEARETTVKATLEKYGLYPATFYYWKKNKSGFLIIDEAIIIESKLKQSSSLTRPQLAAQGISEFTIRGFGGKEVLPNSRTGSYVKELEKDMKITVRRKWVKVYDEETGDVIKDYELI